MSNSYLTLGRKALLSLGALAAFSGLPGGMLSKAAVAAPTESKAVIYLIYNKSNPIQKAYAEDLFKRFNRLGFADRMKSKGVSWVEANYGSVGSVANYLHINSDEVIYFGILMADKSDHITREMFRAHVPVTESDDDKSMRRKADETAHKFYFELADVMDNFTNSFKWKRQQLLIAPTSDKAGLIKVKLDDKDVTDNKTWFTRPPFKRSKINVAMVGATSAWWKRLGADDSGSTAMGGGRYQVWVKKGSRKIIFEMGSNLTDYKTYLANYGPTVEKTFINPVKPAYAYPELQGNNVQCVPLKMVIQELNLPYSFELVDFTVNLKKPGSTTRPVTKPAPRSKAGLPGDDKAGKKDPTKALAPGASNSPASTDGRPAIKP